MPKLSVALFAVATIAAACYQDESLTSSPEAPGAARAKVLLTDAPFPFDSVESVKLYVIDIAVSTRADTGTSADSMHWVTVAAPHRQIDLLSLQLGVTDSLGDGVVAPAQYKAVRLTLNIDSSAGIRFKNGTQAVVHWNGPGLQSYASFVETPITVPETGVAIVVDFDVARSFPYNTRGDGSFDFFATMRAVNRAATGSIAGTVQHDAIGGGAIGPVADATVSAWTGGAGNWHVLTTGKTDATGHYRLAYLLPGTYLLGVDPPTATNVFRSVIDSSVNVIQGSETTHNVTLSH